MIAFFAYSFIDGVSVAKADLCTDIQVEQSSVDFIQPVMAVDDGSSGGISVPETEKSFWDLILENWKIILISLIPLAEIITRLTPTKKDDTFLKWLFSIFPNLKKGGGTHNGK